MQILRHPGRKQSENEKGKEPSCVSSPRSSAVRIAAHGEEETSPARISRDVSGR